MKEFIDKLIGRLKYKLGDVNFEKDTQEVNESYFDGLAYAYGDVINTINQLAEEFATDINVVSNNGWIPFTDRELTEEEKEHYGEDVECMLDCKLPEEDEEILVTSKFKDKLYVGVDTFMKDGSACYLDSGMELVTEAIAWMPLPEAYQQTNERSE